MKTFPENISLFASWKSCFTFCMNLNKRVEVTSLDSINGRLIQMLLRLGTLKLPYSPDLKNGTLFFVTKVFHKGLQCFTLTWDSMSCNGWRQGFMVAWVCTANPSPQKKLPFGDSCLYYSTGHGHCSIFTRVNCVQYGGFTCKKHIRKILHEQLHAT